MNTLNQFLTFLQGKKSTIFTIIALFITFALTKGYIDNDVAILLNGILVALGFSANVASNKMMK